MGVAWQYPEPEKGGRGKKAVKSTEFSGALSSPTRASWRPRCAKGQRAIAAAEAWDLVDTKHGGARRKGQRQEPKNGLLNGKRSVELGNTFGVSKTLVEQARFVLVNDDQPMVITTT